MLKAILFSLGCLSLSLAVVGVFLPILPTTPFLLLASGLFLKSSKRAHRWIAEHPVFGEYISNYVERRGITARHKAISLALLWAAILATALFATDKLWLRVLLPAIACAVTVHVLLVKTLPPRSPDAGVRASGASNEASGHANHPGVPSPEASGREVR